MDAEVARRMWEKAVMERLQNNLGLCWETARSVVAEIAAHREIADSEGYNRGYNDGYEACHLSWCDKTNPT